MLGWQRGAALGRETQHGGCLLKMNDSQTVGSSCPQGEPGSGSRSRNGLLSLLRTGQNGQDGRTGENWQSGRGQGRLWLPLSY